jgi:hypothetical protein
MWVAAAASERDPARIAAEQPALWREIRRFNLPVKLALGAAGRARTALAEPSTALLVALAPTRPGSPELRAISHDLARAFAAPTDTAPRVNPIYTLHAIDNLALSALAIALVNRAPCACFGGAAGQAWVALDHALAAGADEVLVFGGDQGEASWRGEPDADNALGVACVLTARPAGRARIVAVERESGAAAAPLAHAARGLVRWLDALAVAPAGAHRYVVPAADGDGFDRVAVVAEVS